LPEFGAGRVSRPKMLFVWELNPDICKIDGRSKKLRRVRYWPISMRR
jgi:hypothetical protein